MRAVSWSPVFLLLSCAALWAQAVNTAQINGTVRDQSGAPLPVVTITVTQTDTGPGDLENNSLVGPSRFNVDMGVTRSVRVGGGRQIQLRAEAFNVLNRVHLNNPVSALNNPNFGMITLAADPRIVSLR